MTLSRRSFVSAGTALACVTALGCNRQPRLAAYGTPFPAFRLADIDGKTHALSDYAGKPLLVNFWATWCPPCRTEMPDLDAVHQRLAPAGLRVMGVSIDEDVNPVREFRLRRNIGFPLIMDSGRTLSAALGVTTFPTTFLVARNNQIVEALVGPRAWPAYPGIAALL